MDVSETKITDLFNKVHMFEPMKTRLCEPNISLVSLSLIFNNALIQGEKITVFLEFNGLTIRNIRLNIRLNPYSPIFVYFLFFYTINLAPINMSTQESFWIMLRLIFNKH